jgi:hypothetical protein
MKAGKREAVNQYDDKTIYHMTDKTLKSLRSWKTKLADYHDGKKVHLQELLLELITILLDDQVAYQYVSKNWREIWKQEAKIGISMLTHLDALDLILGDILTVCENCDTFVMASEISRSIFDEKKLICPQCSDGENEKNQDYATDNMTCDPEQLEGGK